MSTAAETFRANVRLELDARGLTVTELASRLKISQPALSSVLCGRERVTLDRAERIARCLGIPLASLLADKFSPIG